MTLRPNLWTVSILTFFGALALSGAVQGATIEKVSTDGDTVLLKLSEEEVATVKEGDRISLELDGKGAKPISGTIVKVAGKKAKVAVDAKKGTFKAGRSVQFASTSIEPMSVEPAPVVSEPAPARAGTPGYQSNVYAKTFTNPAQLYQVTHAVADVRTSFRNEQMMGKVSGLKVESELKGPGVGVAAFTSNRGGTLRGGLAVARDDLDGKVKMSGQSSMDEGLETTQITPVVTAEITQGVHAGLAYNIVQERYSGDVHNGKEINLSYAQLVPGVVYVTPTFETGVTFHPRVEESATYTEEDGGEAELPRDIPAKVIAHGRTSLGGGTTAFGELTYAQWRMLNVEEEHGYRNNATIEAGMTKDVGSGTEVLGALSFFSPAHNGDLEKTPERIMKVGATLGYEKSYSATSRFGGAFNYELGREKFKLANGDKGKLETDNYELLITGAVKL